MKLVLFAHMPLQFSLLAKGWNRLQAVFVAATNEMIFEAQIWVFFWLRNSAKKKKKKKKKVITSSKCSSKESSKNDFHILSARPMKLWPKNIYSSTSTMVTS